MKKIVTLLLAICMVFTMAACGSDDSVESQDPTNGTKNTEEFASQPQKHETEAPTKAPDNHESLSVESLMKHKPNPESDFDCNFYDTGLVIISQYLGNDPIVVIPDTWHGNKVIGVGALAFANDSIAEAVVLPDTVTQIDRGSFMLNNNLKVFISGSGLEEIVQASFQGCSNLETVRLNEGLKKIWGLSFSDCPKLKSIEIPDSVEFIEVLAFWGNSDTFTVIGTPGSVAEEAAKADEVQFKAK